MPELPIDLDDMDHRILLELMSQPLVPFSKVAHALGTSTATVTTRYRRMHRQGLVRITGRTAPGFGGRRAYLIRLSAPPERIVRMATAAATQNNSRWVRASLDGSTLIAGLVTDSPHTDPLLTHLPAEPALNSIDVCELLYVWSGAEARGTGFEPRARERAGSKLDGIDETLLTHLATDGRTSVSALAHTLGVNASTVSRRKQRLVDAGVLYFEADVHPKALIGTGDAMLWLTVAPGGIRAAGDTLSKDGRVRFVAATSGSFSLVLHVHVVDNKALLDFVDRDLAAVGATGVDVVPMGRVLKRNAT